VTQQEATLVYWINARNAAASYTIWRFAQDRVDAIFRAMGHAPALFAPLADQELIFPAVKAAFEEREP